MSFKVINNQLNAPHNLFAHGQGRQIIIIIIIFSFTLYLAIYQGRQRELSVKTLRYLISAEFSRYFVLGGETELRVWSTIAGKW